MRSPLAAWAWMAMSVAAGAASADIVELRFISDAGFTSGPHAGQPAVLSIEWDGTTGRQVWLAEWRVRVFDVHTSAVLEIGEAIVLDAQGLSDGRLIVDEGINYLQVTGLGLEAQYSARAQDGPVLGDMPFSIDGASIVDQCVREGAFFPEAFEPHFETSFFRYEGHTADLSRLEVGIITVPCDADFNEDGAADSQDFFDFLQAFFSNEPAADVNADGFINSQDLFDFLDVFFVGC